jgi:hypothetical protein
MIFRGFDAVASLKVDRDVTVQAYRPYPQARSRSLVPPGARTFHGDLVLGFDIWQDQHHPFNVSGGGVQSSPCRTMGAVKSI